MKPRLPNTQAIEAFLRIADGASLVSIAAEMNLTASAISRRIQSLEDAVGTALVDRRGARLMLTPIGTHYAAQATQAMTMLRQAADTARASSDLTLRILSGPSLYANWIAPRLDRFLDNWPTANIQLLTEASQHAAADIRIRSALMDDARPGEDRLIDFQVTPFCRHELIERHAIVTPADLCRAPLIEHVRSDRAWSSWFACAGVLEPIVERKLTVDSSFMMYEAAISGAGVAALPLVYAPVHRAKGLMAPFPQLSTYLGSAFIAALNDRPRPIVRAFRDWIMSDIGD